MDTPTLLQSVRDYVTHVAGTLNETDLKNLGTTLHNVAYSLEDGDDTTLRIGYGHLQAAVVRSGFEIKLFERLAATTQPLSVADLSKQTGAGSLLLGRLLRHLAAVGAIEEMSEGQFAANNVCRNLAAPGNRAGISHIFDTVGPQFQELPKYLKRNGFQDVSNARHVFQDAYKTDLECFPWFQHHPENLENFNNYMVSRRQGRQGWLSVYPVEEEATSCNPLEPVLVNVGGSIGHQCAEFKARYPEIRGRVILQDLQHSIDQALQTPGVENMTHNFFEPQPIKGAKFYLLRAVLHNHPDERVRLILKNIVAAMGKDSTIILDEMVLPNSHVGWYSSSIDLAMMCAFGSRERTEAQWTEVFDSVGLKLVKKLTYKPAYYETILSLKPVQVV